ncbi:MAG: dephospho-CoA kinase [Prochlorococcaceae cyanobacterium]
MTAAHADDSAVCHRLAGVLFPWDVTRALEIALLKTFCVPSIAGLLDRSGEFGQRPRRRYDDTGLWVAELLRHSPDSDEGRQLIDRLNRLHGRYAIANDDFLYVLSTFVAEPIRWLGRYGWRPLTPAEQEALFGFWKRVGEGMRLQHLPADLGALLALNRRVEDQLFAGTAAGRRVAEATLTMLLADWPPPLRPALRSLLTNLVEPGVGACLGWSTPPGWQQQLVLAGLRLRSRASGWSQQLRPPRQSRFYSQRPTPSHGARFRYDRLGPPPLLDGLNRPRWRGPQRRIGLTGGIASGKSSVGRLLADRHGLSLLDADVYAREALAPGSAGARAVLEHFGSGVAAAGAIDTVDRRALGRLVFADAAERRWLEQLVHPLVRARCDAELARLAGAPVVVLMVPLLFEAGLDGLCSEVWLVDCDEDQQLQRLMARDGAGEADARARIAAQWPLARKRPLADRLIDNRGSAQQLVVQVAAAVAAMAEGQN